MSEVTVGSIKALYDGDKKSPLVKHPCVQIISIKSVETNGKTRYRALISDGIHIMQAMLATKYAPVVEQKKIKRNTIVRLKESVCNEMEFRKILIVLELDIVTVDVNSQIGSPVQLGQFNDPSSPTPNSANRRPSSSFSAHPSMNSSSQFTSSQMSAYQNLPSTQQLLNNNNNNNNNYAVSSSQQSLNNNNNSYAAPSSQLPSSQSSWSSQGFPSAKIKTENEPYRRDSLLYSNSQGQPSSQNIQFSQPNSVNSVSFGSQRNTTPPSSSQQNSVNLFTPGAGHVRMIGARRPLTRTVVPLIGISELSPHIRSWSIKARVSMKTPIRSWQNARTSGQLFNVNFVDQTGEIGATGFNEQVTRFFNLLQDGQVYTISKARITMNNKRFSNLTSDYEIHFDNGTEIKLVPDDPSIPHMVMNQVKLCDLDQYPLHSIVDVMGIVVEDKGMFEVIKKTYGGGGKLVYKREIMIVDQSLQKVKFTLWDDEARDFDTSGRPVIVCKGARVGNYQGAYLSTSPNTTIKRNAFHPDAKKLKEWYESVGHCMDYKMFQPVGTDEISDKLPKINLTTAIRDKYGFPNRPEYFVCRATITFIKPDNAIYAGCPDCKKKLDVNDGKWLCERCERSYKEPVWKYILTVSIDDSTGQMYVNMFDELTTLLFGVSAQQFMSLKETDESTADSLINKILFETYNFKIRARTERYNGMDRIKYQVVEMNEINLIKESKIILNDIESLL